MKIPQKVVSWAAHTPSGWRVTTSDDTIRVAIQAGSNLVLDGQGCSVEKKTPGDETLELTVDQLLWITSTIQLLHGLEGNPLYRRVSQMEAALKAGA